jgi:hypothetical protein
MVPIVSITTAKILIRIAFLVGVFTDGLALIPMLSRKVGVALFGGDASQDNAPYRYAMSIGASLMAGWTLLLLWGTFNPIERRGLLLLTVFPVISGIVLATIVAVNNGVVLRSRFVPVWIHLGSVSLFYIVAYVLSIPFTP